MSGDVFVVVEHLQGVVEEISYANLAAARHFAERRGGWVIALLLGHQVEHLAADLNADQVWYVEHERLAVFNPEAYRQVVAGLVREHKPALLLVGDTSIGADFAGALSMQLELPLVSACRELSYADGRLSTVSQTCGGRILVESQGLGPALIASMVPGAYRPEDGRRASPPDLMLMPPPKLEGLKVTALEILQPQAGDVDISREEILVAVGRGIQNQDNLELAQELAEALGGVLCASRPVVDQGWLPSTRLVGKSGKQVKARLYLALGISGAPEHVEAIGAAETVIAVNSDPGAPIFNYAHYGVEDDLFDIVPALTEKIQQVRAGVA